MDRRFCSQWVNDMVCSPFRGWPAIPWLDIATGAQTEHRGGAGPAGACLAVRTPPAAFVDSIPVGRFCKPPVFAGRFANPLYSDDSIFLLCDPDKSRRLGSELAEVLSCRLVLVHPFDGPAVPLASFFPFAPLPVGH